VLTACLVVAARRTDAPWAMSFRPYLWLGLLVIVLRVAFRVVFGGQYGDTVVLDLPLVPLPGWAAGITLFGPVTSESLLFGLYDGMRLATLLICVGAANTLANPKRLLASLPPALYEVGTAVVIALSLFPQLAESVQRVQRARRLRGDPGRGVGALRRVVVPVLEDALEKSLALAASMDARGYGRSGDLTARWRRVTGMLLVTGLVGLCVGTYAFLDATAPRALAWPMLLVGLVLAVAGFVTAGRRVTRTRYRPDRWRPAELLTAGTGVAVAVLFMIATRQRPDVAYPDPSGWPEVSALALVAVLVGVLPAFATPLPAEAGRTGPTDAQVSPHEEVAA
jgi:energy-coupling factor transport system permease protein